MATSYTSFLGLALPVTGELQGTWGDVVNDSITSLLDSAIAGTTTLSTDGDVTLTTTNGASNQAREAILLCSGARTALRTITAPAQSKIYTIINATTGGYAVKLVGAGPTTGLTIPNGASAVVAWNGSDFIEIGSSTIGNLTVNGNLSVTGTTTLTGAATLTANPTLSGGTANGVAYLNGSKVLTSGSALTFDGTRLGVTGTTPTYFLNESDQTTDEKNWDIISGSKQFQIRLVNDAYSSAVTAINIVRGTGTDISSTRFNTGSGTEGMRLTSTGLGIGTSSPSAVSGGTVLEVSNATGSEVFVTRADTTLTAGDFIGGFGFKNTDADGTPPHYAGFKAFASSIENGAMDLHFYSARAGYEANIASMVLDSSGNLGLGVTPSAWSTSAKAFQLGAYSALYQNSSGYPEVSFNTYQNASNIYTYQVSSNPATRFSQTNGAFQWFIAPSGTAGATITFTQAMTLDTDNSLRVGPSGSYNFWLQQGSSQNTFYSYNNGSDHVMAFRGSQYKWFIASGSTQAMTLDASGNLGIGTTSPATQLHVNSAANTTVTIDSGGTAYASVVSFVADSERAKIIGGYQSGGGGYLAFNTDSTGGSDVERARIDSSGNLLVGTTTAAGNGCQTNAPNGWGVARYLTDQSGRRNWAISTESLNAGDICLVASTANNTAPNTVRFQVRSDGSTFNSTGTYGTISDVKLKENIVDTAPKLADLLQVRVVNYNRIGEQRKELGVIAQELEKIFPGMIDEQEDLVDGKPAGTTTKAVKYSVFVPMLIKAIQEQQAIINQLKADVAALKGA